MDPMLHWREAEPSDVDRLFELVQAAYRGAGGWTSEVGLIEGERIGPGELRAEIGSPRAVVMVVPDGEAVIACCIVHGGDGPIAHFGLFAVDPGRQAGGVGRRLMAAARRVAFERFAADTLEITVVSGQPALAAWYERLGFAATGETIPFPDDPTDRALVAGLHFIVMRAPTRRPPYALSWSGGKDSALALHSLTADGEPPPSALITTITADHERISMHGVRRELLRGQADAIGIDLVEVRIPAGASNEIYEASFRGRSRRRRSSTSRRSRSVTCSSAMCAPTASASVRPPGDARGFRCGAEERAPLPSGSSGWASGRESCAWTRAGSPRRSPGGSSTTGCWRSCRTTSTRAARTVSSTPSYPTGRDSGPRSPVARARSSNATASCSRTWCPARERRWRAGHARPAGRGTPGSREQGAMSPDVEAWVYMLRCGDGSLYTGWTVDLERRLARHQAGTASRYTASRLPVALAFAQPMADRTAARREEARIKRLSRTAKLALVRQAPELPAHAA